MKRRTGLLYTLDIFTYISLLLLRASIHVDRFGLSKKPVAQNISSNGSINDNRKKNHTSWIDVILWCSDEVYLFRKKKNIYHIKKL